MGQHSRKKGSGVKAGLFGPLGLEMRLECRGVQRWGELGPGSGKLAGARLDVAWGSKWFKTASKRVRKPKRGRFGGALSVL
jgi:hypothetical protein